MTFKSWFQKHRNKIAIGGGVLGGLVGGGLGLYQIRRNNLLRRDRLQYGRIHQGSLQHFPAGLHVPHIGEIHDSSLAHFPQPQNIMVHGFNPPQQAQIKDLYGKYVQLNHDKAKLGLANYSGS